MYEIKSAIIQFSQWLYPWLGEIAIAILASIIVLYGEVINRFVKQRILGFHVIIRTLIFMLLCVFGYGAVLIFISPLLSQWLASVSMMYLGPLILGVFIVLGIIAERKPSY